jgi:hypothetical protein
MLSPQIAAARVAQGAAFLDRVRPGWEHTIDVDTLAMRRCSRCVLGQVYGDYSAVAEHFGWSPYTWRMLSLPQVALGFTLADVDICDGPVQADGEAIVDAAWRTLGDAWIGAIALRRCVVADGEAHDLVTV